MNEQIGNKINDKTYIKLTPFKGFVLENFPFIEADFDAITNYQLLCKVIEYLNNVISNQNTVQELGTDLVNAYNSLVDAVNLAIGEFESSITNDFNTLHDYVYNYFDNLDVQEEINTKLDEMVEDGTLQEIITDYLNTKAIFGYDNVASMKQATNLINGSYTKTLGYYSKNDGGGAFYKIRTKTNDDVIDNVTIIPLSESSNNLIAELIIEYEMNSKCFNIIGDGVTDDSDALQHALNITNIVCNKNESYKITKTIYVNHSLNGNNNTFLIPDLADLVSDSPRGIFIVNQKNIIVKNCKFIGNYTDYTQKIPYITNNILPPILSYMDGSDNSQCIGCHFEKTNGHSVIVYGNTVNNILIENSKAIDCGVGVAVEQINANDETPKNITINNFYSKCNNACGITSGSGISVNNCYFESNGYGKAIVTTNEVYHDTHVDFNGCTFTHTGIGADIGQSRCLFVDSYSGVKNVFVNLTTCKINGDITGVRSIYISTKVKLSIISSELKGLVSVIGGSYLDVINSTWSASTNNGNILILNDENSRCTITNSDVNITSTAADIWTKGSLTVINSSIISDNNSITFKDTSKGLIIGSKLTKIINSETRFGVTIFSSTFTNDTRFLTDNVNVIGSVNNATDLANLPTTLPNCSMILVIETKKIAYKYGTQWFYVDGTYISG